MNYIGVKNLYKKLVIQARNRKKYGNKAEMKAFQFLLLSNMAKKKDKEDYPTCISVARHIFATDVM